MRRLSGAAANAVSDAVMTLEQLLASRDRRVAMQRRLLALHPRQALVVITVVMPGNNKQSRAAAIVAQAARTAVEKAFGCLISSRLIRDLVTGYEAYFTVSATPEEAKKIAVDIEESHPLGRLMDIDIIGYDGIPLSRNKQRQCLLCRRPARECMRANSHSLTEILSHIDFLCDEYLQRP